MKTPSQKRWERALIYTMVVLAFIGIGFGLYLLKQFILLPLGILIVAPFVGFLYLKNESTNDNSLGKTDDVIQLVFFLCLVCSIVVLARFDLQKAMLSKMFVDGKIKKESVWQESDGEQVAHWEDVHSFVAKSEIGQIISGNVGWLIGAIICAAMYFSFQFLGQTKKYKEDIAKKKR